MHNAPSVNYPVGRSRFAGVLLLAAWVAGVVALGAWTSQVQASAMQILLAWSAVLLAGCAALWTWARTPTGVLAWDGQAWIWTVGQCAMQAHPLVVLDLQHALLLRFGGGQRAPWLWLEKRASPRGWDDLRRAVYSRARTEGPPGGTQPSETTK